MVDHLRSVIWLEFRKLFYSALAVCPSIPIFSTMRKQQYQQQTGKSYWLFLTDQTKCIIARNSFF